MGPGILKTTGATLIEASKLETCGQVSMESQAGRDEMQGRPGKGLTC